MSSYPPPSHDDGSRWQEPPAAPYYQPQPQYPQPPPHATQPFAAPPYPTPGMYAYAPIAVTPPASGAAVTGLIFGILSYLGLFGIGSIVAVICGHVALGQIKSSGGRVGGNGMAVAALILGYLQLAGWIILLAIVILFGVAAAGSSSRRY